MSLADDDGPTGMTRHASVEYIADLLPPAKAAQAEEEEETGRANLGGKTIGFFGSIVLNVNNIAGPGMLAVPMVYQQAGYVIPTLVLLITTVLASLAATCICEAMNLIPGNQLYDERVEFSTVIKHYFGKKAYIAGQIFYNLNLLSLNIASILAAAQVMDQLFVFAFGHSWAVHFIPPFKWIAIGRGYVGNNVFAGEGMVLTAGYVATLLLCMPMGFLNLDENIYFQYISFAILVGLVIEFMYAFSDRVLVTDRVPAFAGDLTQVFGVITFSFAFVVTVPSWVNEKRTPVSVNKVIWTSTSSCAVAYLIVGLMGAMAYDHASMAGNILLVISKPKNAPIITKLSVYIFAIGVIGLGIPLFSVMVRYNLYVGGVCGRKLSAFFGVVFPWLVAMFLYQGKGFTNFVNWSSLLIGSVINFVIPFALYIKARSDIARNGRTSRVGSLAEHTPLLGTATDYTYGDVDSTDGQFSDDDDNAVDDDDDDPFASKGSIQTIGGSQRVVFDALRGDDVDSIDESVDLQDPIIAKAVERKRHKAFPWRWRWGAKVYPMTLLVVTFVFVTATVILDLVSQFVYHKNVFG